MPSKTWNLRQINVGGTNPNRLWWDEDAAAAAATSVTGWNVRTTTTNYNTTGLSQGAEITGWGTTAIPNATAPTVDNSYAATAIYTPPTLLSSTDSISTLYEYNGVFPAGNWVFNFPVISVTLGATGSGAITMRVFKGVRSGTAWASVTQLTGALLQGTTISNLSTTVTQTTTVTWSAPEFRLNNEFLICKMGWRILTASGGNNADVVLRWGTGANMTSTNFKKRSYNTT